MPSPPTVTLIIRSMGRPCLPDAVASVDRQQYGPIELLVVDASGEGHPPLSPTPHLSAAKLIGAGRRLSRPAAANFGLEHATGDWIGFLDDDDFIDPSHVARLVARAVEPDAPTLVFGQLWHLDRLHRVVHDRHHGFNPLVMYYYCRTPGMSCLLHRGLRDAGHRIDETFENSEDWEFWLRLLPHAKVGTVREPTHFYFMEAGTSGSGWGRNRHASEIQQRCHDAILARYAGERERAWSTHFMRLREGMALQAEGRIDAAAALYAEILRTYPDEPNALYLLAQAYEGMGRLHAARLLLRDALYFNGDAAQYHLALGRVCEMLEAYDEARDAFANAAHFDPNLRSVVDEALGRLSEHVVAPSLPPEQAVAVVSRNAPCPCGSGLRYKACHGAAAQPSATSAPSHVPADAASMQRALVAAQSGDNREAQARYREILAQDPQSAEALHALAWLEFDMGEVDRAVGRMEEALAHAADDPQIAEDHRRLRLYVHERATAERAYAELARLPFLVPCTAALPAPPPGSDIHVVVPFRDPSGERELAAMQLARRLGGDAPVTVWSTCAEAVARRRTSGVREVDVRRGSFPRSGALIFVGLDPVPPVWLGACAAARVVVVYDGDGPALLLDLVLAAHAASECPIQIVTPSEVFRRRCGIPAASCPLPLALEPSPIAGGEAHARPFTVGRHGRNDHRLFHPDDPALFRQMTRSGMAVRILGGTVLMRHFPPSRPVTGLELLAADALPPDTFLCEIDCMFYRTAPLHPDPSGRCIAQALVAGVPVVCARDVGYSELITHGVEGFVFDRDDDAAALQYLSSLQADVALRARMRRAARAKAEATFGPALDRRLRRLFVGVRAAARSIATLEQPIDYARG